MGRHQLEDEQDAGRSRQLRRRAAERSPFPAASRRSCCRLTRRLARVRDRLPADSPVLLGAQNAHWAVEGPWTGEISMRMAKDAGATLIEIGHSERREHFGETDRTVALKAAAAVAHGLIPLICVGEPMAVRDVGGAEDFVRVQLQTRPLRVGAGRDQSGDHRVRTHLGHWRARAFPRPSIRSDR